MFADIISNEKAKVFLKNELKFDRESGTYLFYGIDRGLLKRFAKNFAKSLNCIEVEYDFCDKCESCLRIETETHGDLEILEDNSGIKIEKIRELGYKDSINSYEGRKKIYIIRDVDKLRKESGNALLKLIEEPNKGSFFILLSSTLNVLPTIKSRSIIVKIEQQTAEELGVTSFEYNFFQGDALEIEEYEKREDIDLQVGESYENIGVSLKKWQEGFDFKDKVEVYKSIRDFINVKDYLNVADKIYFIDEILNSGVEKDFIKNLINYLINLLDKKSNKLEEFLELKGMLKSPINLKNLLISLLSKI